MSDAYGREAPGDPERGLGDAPTPAGTAEDVGARAAGAAGLPARLTDNLPTTLPILISQLGPVFPGMMSPIPLPNVLGTNTAESAQGYVGVVALRPQASTEAEQIDVRFLYEVGCVGRIMQKVRAPDGTPAVVMMCTRRMRVVNWVKTDTVLLAEVDYPDDVIRDGREVEALARRARQSFKELAELNPELPKELAVLLDQLTEPGHFADFVGYNLGKTVEAKQSLLSTFEVDARLRQALLMVEKELELATLGAKLREEIRGSIESRQKEHFLREQLKAIRRELGEEVDQRELLSETYLKKITDAQMSAEGEKRARQELERLSLLPAEAPDHHVIRNYLDWLVDLPWAKLSAADVDVARAARILDEDHHGLTEVKERILEFLAVRKLKPDQQGAILCLVGPPGVGKTSLGKSVARATNREFYRLSLGGMRDEAEIKGHRRTYVGAMPGKIIQGLRRVGHRNPVFMLDEIDKLSSDWRGDPSSALLEVLDPAQNHAFEDLYVDLPFDLSQVLFVATANVAAQIPAPLLDRMELIQLAGYIPSEKQAIGRRYLLPRQLEAHGLTKQQVKVNPTAMADIVERYTREAGVRELERMIGRVCRKVAAKVAARGPRQRRLDVVVTPKNLATFLGPQRYFRERFERCKRPGVVVGLAWTPVGGEILFIEATSMAGSGPLQLTGKLGEVMSESARIALSLIRSRAKDFGIADSVFQERQLHLHVPAGAVPKDGPSAGVAMACALLSLLWQGKGQVPAARVAMTGELTLRGAVLPVGGIREKVIAAKRAGIKTIIVPAQNQPDVAEIPPEVTQGIRFVFAATLDDVVDVAIGRRNLVS